MSNEREVYVVGAGGHAKVVVSTLQAAGYTVKGLFDDDPEKRAKSVLGAPVLGPTAEFGWLKHGRAVIGVGDNASRKTLARRFGDAEWITVIHPTAYVHPSVRLGPGTVVFAGATVQPDTTLGSHCIINTAACVDHDCILADYVHVAPGTRLAGGVELGEGVFMGIGSSVIPGIKVGSWTVVGAGGVVICDLMPAVLAVGVPASPTKNTKKTESP